MGERNKRRYRKRKEQHVTAVQIRLETAGLEYEKWGAKQTGRPGDWLIDNDGDVYTISEDSFDSTYEQVSPGRYRKVAAVWAVQASRNGAVKTREGETVYEAGDYLVSNNDDGDDEYAVSKERFEQMYVEVD